MQFTAAERFPARCSKMRMKSKQVNMLEELETATMSEEVRGLKMFIVNADGKHRSAEL